MRPASRVHAATLSPDEAQACFRAVLDALARPGTPTALPAGPAGRVPPSLLPALALADLDTPVCVLGDDGPAGDGGWSATLATVTSAPCTAATGARLGAALRPLRPGELSAFPIGTPATPEDGALVAVGVPGLDDGPPLRLTGPGVDGEILIAPQVGDLLAERATVVGGFPTGLDLLLVDPHGRLLGLPRTTTVEEI